MLVSQVQGFRHMPRWFLNLASLCMLAVILSACATAITRSPVPEDKINIAAPYGIRLEKGVLRGWGDELSPEAQEAFKTGWIETQRLPYSRRSGQALVLLAATDAGWPWLGARTSKTCMRGISIR